MPIELTTEERRYFRDELRRARGAALRRAEEFQSIVTALERLGAFLVPTGTGLGAFRQVLVELAARESDGGQAASCDALHALFTTMKNGRNDAIHEGAYARHLVKHCVEFAINVEAGLMAGLDTVADFMVSDPTCAQVWQPIGVARQHMLANSFSYLPIRFHDHWMLLSDYSISSYISKCGAGSAALRKQIGAACDAGELQLDPATVLQPGTSRAEAIRASGGRPVLILDGERLIGIATPFDFL